MVPQGRDDVIVQAQPPLLSTTVYAVAMAVELAKAMSYSVTAETILSRERRCQAC
jgi:hypothetical protein